MTKTHMSNMIVIVRIIMMGKAAITAKKAIGWNEIISGGRKLVWVAEIDK